MLTLDQFDAYPVHKLPKAVPSGCSPMSFAFAASLLGKPVSSREMARAFGYDRSLGSGPVARLHGIAHLVRKGFRVTCASQPGGKLPPYTFWLGPHASVDIHAHLKSMRWGGGSPAALAAIAADFSEARLASARRLFEKGGVLAGTAYKEERRKVTARYLADMLRSDRATVALTSIWVGEPTLHMVALAGCERRQNGTYDLGMYSTDQSPRRSHEPLQGVADHVRQERSDYLFITR